jgi:serine phosphatase RsbU (regulator of sigma subunit)
MENNNQTIETNVDTQTTEQPEVKTFTQEEVDAMIAEKTKDMLSKDDVNSIIEKRLAKEKAKAEKERTQAEELAKLSAEERKAKEFEIEMQKKTDEFNAEMAKFTQMKQDFERQQLISQVTKELATRNLPVDLSEQLIGADVESTMKNIEIFEKSFNESLQKAVDNKLKNSSSSPKTELKGNENQSKKLSDMTLSEYIDYTSKNQ